MKQEPNHSDFEKARQIATQCLYNGNSLIGCAKREPRVTIFCGAPLQEFHLAGAARTYCEFLEASTGIIGRIDPYLVAVVTEPQKHWRLCTATAHSLAWSFAHNLWLGMASVVSRHHILKGAVDAGCGRKGFLLDPDVVSMEWEAIRASLLDRMPPIDADHFSAVIRIEAQKAIANSATTRALFEILADEMTITEIMKDWDIPLSALSKAAALPDDDPGHLSSRGVGRNRLVPRAHAEKFARDYANRRELRAVNKSLRK